MFSYRTLIKQSFLATWKYRYLWFFGLFAAIVAGNGSWEYQLLTQNFNQNTVDGSYAIFNQLMGYIDLIQNILLGLVNLFSYDFLTIVNTFSVLLLALILIISFIWLAIISQSALVSDAKIILTTKKKDLKFNIKEDISKASPYFLRVLCLNIIAKILTTSIFIIIGLPLLLMVIKDTWILAATYTVLFVIFIPLSMSISLIAKYAIAYTILDNKSFIDSLNHAWRLFKNNWLVSLEMAVILFITNFIASGIIIMILCILLIPPLLLSLIFQITWLTYLIVFIAISIVAILGSGLVVFQINSWVKLFLSLKENKILAKLERLFLGRFSI